MMKKIVILVSLALVLGLVLIGCPQPTDGENGGGETPAPVETGVFGTVESANVGTLIGVKGGIYTYQEGSSNPEPNTSVGDFYLAETEVTQGQWEEVMGEWPGTDPANDDSGDGDDYPAYYVSWYDAIKFCNELSIEEQLDPVYYTESEYPESPNITKETKLQKIDYKDSFISPEINADFTKNGYRLPTEVEWEYAAGGGDSSARTIYAAPITVDELDPNDFDDDGNTNEADGIDDEDTTKDLRQYAWYWGNNESRCSKIVGTAGSEENTPIAKSGNKNALGLYDMSGNIWEWCYEGSSHRAVRGGCYFSSLSDLSVTNRHYYDSSKADLRLVDVGFRVARNAE